MMRSSSWEANSYSLSKEINRILWNPNVRHHFENSPPLSLSWIRPIQFTPSNMINFNIILPSSLSIPSVLYPYGFHVKMNAFLFSLSRATCPAHLNLFHLITHIIFGEVYKLRSSSLCSSLQFPVNSPLLGPSIFLSPHFRTPAACALPAMWQTNLQTYMNQQIVIT
jgi:hypothetical protein